MKDFKQDVKTHKEKLMQSHRVKQRIDQIQEASRKLVSGAQHPGLPALRPAAAASPCVLALGTGRKATVRPTVA